MNNCIDCKHHEVIPDPDPHDSFCSDDVAVACTLSHRVVDTEDSLYLADHHPFRCVTVSCRPYNIRKESEVPEWCPLKSL